MKVESRCVRVVSSGYACVGALLLAAVSAAADVPPRVLGFDRAYAASDANRVSAGQLLLGELSCTSCHAATGDAAKQIERKAAPVLDTLATRVKPEYLRLFLNDPQATKPGTTMPNVLAGKSEAERAEIVDSLVHFLATTGTNTVTNPSRYAVERGEVLFHSAGCVACHDPRNNQPVEPVAASIPLGTPSKKYTLPGLTQFLQEPLAVRPGGRMPDLNLSPAEARDVASFLCNDMEIVAGLHYAYYEGEWDKLPKFDTLTPVATGDAENFDLKPARRKDHFALRFEGTIELPEEGDYLFLIGSDDGSRLLIDDKVIVVGDGIHPFEQKRKKVKMTAGAHSVVVEYFENNGEEALQVDFEPPGGLQQPLAALLTSPAKATSTGKPQESFAIDSAKAAKGREYFVSLGCASCHTLRQRGSPLVATKTAKPLTELKGSGGCLDASASGTPRYTLSKLQMESLTAAIGVWKKPLSEVSPSEQVNQTLVRFNCVACHERNKLGGVMEARDKFFLSDMPEMGDEGRIPPSLTGVGAKLRPEWLKHLFAEGAKDRTYMLTRMPKFGVANVGNLVPAFEQADAALIKSAPSPTIASDDEKRVKAAGRRLVGAQGFSCIKCHTFANQKSSGIQALSLTTMTQRLRHDWFFHYLQSPLTYRPGTRMPTPFPDGQVLLPTVLDGTVPSQIEGIWQYLADGDKATFPVGLVTGKIELMPFFEAIVYRNFIEGAGTRAIGVGYPEKLNLAFDANDMRLALLWHGGFIDAARHWTARGQGFEKPLGDNVLKLPEGPSLAVLANSDAPWPEATAAEAGIRFNGYRLGAKQQPTFQYYWQDLSIEDWPRPVGKEDLFTMQRTLSFSGRQADNNGWFRAARAGSIQEQASGTFRIDDRWTLTVSGDTKAIVRKQKNEMELLVPIKLTDGKATIELNYDW